MWTDRTGDLICRGCGEVLAERLVDDAPEWNVYEDEGKGDPSRVGGALDDRNDRLFGGGHKRKRPRVNGAGGDYEAVSAKRTKTQKRLAGVCVRLDNEVRVRQLPSSVKDMGLEVADQAEQKGVFRGADEDVMLGALLFVACRQLGVSLTLKDVVSYTGADKVEIGRLATKISKLVPGLQNSILSPAKLARKYASDLKLPENLKSMAEDMVENARNLEQVAGSQPQTLAAAVLLLMCRVRSTMNESHDHPIRSLEEIASTSSMSQPTIKKAYVSIFQRREEIMTPAFRQLLEGKNLELVPPPQ